MGGGTGTERFPASVFGVALQITSPFVPSFLFAVFHINVLLTLIEEFSKSRSSIVNASNSFIRKAEANRVLQINLNLRLALLLSKLSR